MNSKEIWPTILIAVMVVIIGLGMGHWQYTDAHRRAEKLHACVEFKFLIARGWTVVPCDEKGGGTQ